MSSNPYAPPNAPVEDPVAPAAAIRPPTATWAVRLLWLGMGTGIVAGVYSLYSVPGGLKLLNSIVLMIAMGFTVLFMSLWIWFIIAASRGRNWARIVITVIIALGLLYNLRVYTRFLSVFTATTGLIAVLQLLLQIATIVLFFLPPSNAWYRSMRNR